MENESIWTSGAKDSWFSQAKLARSRSLMHCERKAMDNTQGLKYFYYISCDVARSGNNDTSIMVIKVVQHKDYWEKRVVYTENMTNTMMSVQALRIKQLNQLYHPREICVDGNTIGMGLLDALVMTSIDDKGILYEPLYVSNNPDNYPVPRECKNKAIIYDIQANAQLNSDIYSNLYLQFNSGLVKLLANERVVKEKLLSTKKGQRMNYYQREKFLLPYIMTSRLIDEINNLKLKPVAANQISVEQISRRINKDRVSALSYGLYRIKVFEDKELRRQRNGSAAKQMAFFTSSKNRKKGE